MKFATKPIQHYPPHLKHMATLTWEIEKSNILQIFSRYGKMKQIAFISLLTLLFIHKFGYFRCLRSRVFPVLIANKIFCVTVFFYLFTFAISLWLRKFITADVTAVNMAFSDEDKILIETHKYAQHRQLHA